MNDLVKVWWSNLIDDEMDNIVGARLNEKIWADGSPDEDTRKIHLEIVENLKRYSEFLAKMKELGMKEIDK